MPGRRAAPPASPPCEAAIADDLYMGFAPRDELLAACAGLLQAERSILRQQRAATGDPVRLAEAEVCEGLAIAVLAALGGDPAPAMADGAPAADEAGGGSWQAQQAALATRLSTLLPRVRDDRLHALLCALRRRHQDGAVAGR